MIIDVIIPPKAERPRWLSNTWVFIQDLCYTLYLTDGCAKDGTTIDAAWCESALQGRPDWVEITLHHRPVWCRVAEKMLSFPNHSRFYRRNVTIDEMASFLKGTVRLHRDYGRGPCASYTPCITVVYTSVERKLRVVRRNPFTWELE